MWVIDKAFPIAGRRPYLLLGQCELALDTFLPEDAHLASSDVLRVLLTKVSRSPPFLMGEVVRPFASFVLVPVLSMLPCCSWWWRRRRRRRRWWWFVVRVMVPAFLCPLRRGPRVYEALTLGLPSMRL